jgi:hypothetical protein
MANELAAPINVKAVAQLYIRRATTGASLVRAAATGLRHSKAVTP